MTRHDDAMSLRHMLDHATEAVEMAQGRRRDDLDSDRQLNLCLVRLRNRLIHAYDKVDFNILWDVVQLDLPPLIEQLKTALGFDGENQI